MTFNTLGIILKREPWKETGRIYTIYTREAGKVLAVGRATRKPISKLSAHLEPFTLAELHLAHGRRTETICGARLQRSPEPLVADEARHAAAAFAVEAFDHFVKYGERDLKLWDLLDGYLVGLQDAPEADIHQRLESHVWDFMDALGYRPNIEACAMCETVPFGDTRFLPVRGVIVCMRCEPDERMLAGVERYRHGEPNLRAGLAFLEAHLDKPIWSLPIVRGLLISDAEKATVRVF